MVIEVHQAPSPSPPSLMVTEENPTEAADEREEIPNQIAAFSTSMTSILTKTPPFAEIGTHAGTDDIIITDQVSCHGTDSKTFIHGPWTH